MFDAEDELDLALNPDDVVRVEDLQADVPEAFDETGAVPVAANPAAAFDPDFMPPPEFGSPPPPELASPTPTAPAGPNETWPPPVPAEAPGQVAPGGKAAPESTTDGQDIEGALADRDAARTDLDRKKSIQHRLENQDRLDYAESRRKELEARAAQDLARQQSDAAADEKAKAQIAQTEEALRPERFKAMWASKSNGNNAAKILSGALLAIGAGMMKTPQHAIAILNKQREADHQEQMDNLALLKDDYVRARTGMQDAQLARQKMAADVMLGRARKDELMAKQFEEAAAKTKNDDAALYAAQLKKDAADARVQSYTTLRNLHLKDEENELSRRLKESQITANEANARLRDRGLGQGRKGPKGTGNGGGGGGRNIDAVSELTAMIENGRPGADGKTEPYPTPELQKFAASKGIPLTGKAGTVNLDGLLKSTAFRQKTADAHTKAGNVDAYAQQRNKFLEEKYKNLVGSLDVLDENGKPIGKAFDAKSADRLRKQVQTYDQFKIRMNALINDINEHGERVGSVDEWQRRDGLASAAAAAGRVYNGLGATDASQKLEALINGATGTPGHGWWTGANVELLKHNNEEAAHQHQTRINTGVRAGSPGAKPHVEGGGENKPKEPRDDAKIARAKKAANDPAATEKSKLGAKNFLALYGETP